MPIFVKETGGDSTPVPQGTHLAICYRIVDAGSEYSEMYKKHSQKLIISWELPNEKMVVDGVEKPMGISGTYTASLSDKAGLRKVLESWRGRQFTAEELKMFDISKVLGSVCMLSVVHTEKGSAKVTAVMAAPKGTPKMVPYNPIVEYSQTDGLNDAFQTLPEWLQKRISACEEWKSPALIKTQPEPSAVADEEEDTQIPF